VGTERTARVNPIDQRLHDGASLAAGTHIARPFNPLLNVRVMVTRGTKAASVQGVEHAIDPATAVELYTVGEARLDHEEQSRGTLEVGRLADLVAYSTGPLTADIERG